MELVPRYRTVNGEYNRGMKALEQRSAITMVPAAQYVRMSTEDQQYSIENQQSVIQTYAEDHGYVIVSTYEDPGKSGISIRNRAGLRSLLHDVTTGQPRFKTILVYDISRWGRFQDVDEAAHYEFLCRHSGIPVHYCAEQFENDGSLPSSIMKALKRTMAAEYSRELGIKVFAGQQRLVQLGYKVGGMAGYGLRRMMISSDGTQRRILKDNERKAVTTDRVILVPGPKKEVECIRTIFTLASDKRKSPGQIVMELNRRKIVWTKGKSWNNQAVWRVLKNEKYVGCNTWGKTQKKLNGPCRRVARTEWISKNNAFTPIIEQRIFDKVQRLIAKRKTYPRKPDSYLLDGMRRVLAREGKLSEKLLKGRGIFDHRTYCKRFGSVLRAYQLVGYQPSPHAFKSVANQTEMRCLRWDLLNKLKALFPEQLRLMHLRGQRHRQVIELDGHFCVSVHICRPVKESMNGEPRWLLTDHPLERGLPALICTADPEHKRLLGFYLIPEFQKIIRRYKVLAENHAWLRTGTKLEDLSQFYEVAKKLADGRRGEECNILIGDVTISTRTYSILIGTKEISLGPVGSALFNLMILHAGEVISRKQLSRSVIGKELASANLNVHISDLRKRLGAQFLTRIKTVIGLGYLYASDTNPAQ